MSRVMTPTLGRNADGEPLCRGADWTAEPFPPSSLAGPVEVGGCSYISRDEYVERVYTVRPDGTATVTTTVEVPWGSGHVETRIREFPAGSWLCDTWSHWPQGFGYRWGTCIVRAS